MQISELCCDSYGVFLMVNAHQKGFRKLTTTPTDHYCLLEFPMLTGKYALHWWLKICAMYFLCFYVSKNPPISCKQTVFEHVLSRTTSVLSGSVLPTLIHLAQLKASSFNICSCKISSKESSFNQNTISNTAETAVVSRHLCVQLFCVPRLLCCCSSCSQWSPLFHSRLLSCFLFTFLL